MSLSKIMNFVLHGGYLLLVAYHSVVRLLKYIRIGHSIHLLQPMKRGHSHLIPAHYNSSDLELTVKNNLSDPVKHLCWSSPPRFGRCRKIMSFRTVVLGSGSKANLKSTIPLLSGFPCCSLCHVFKPVDQQFQSVNNYPGRSN